MRRFFCAFEVQGQFENCEVTEMAYRPSPERMARSASILFATLVRYPEVATVHYDPRHETVRVSLMVGGLTDAEFEAACSRLVQMLEVYHMLDGRGTGVVKVERETYGELSSLNITRDVATMTVEEVYTLIEFMRERFAGRMITEPVEMVHEEELMAQDEMIFDMMEDLRRSKNSRNLIAIREDGRVMVFSK